MRNIKQKRINFVFTNTKLCRYKAKKKWNTSKPYKNWNLNKSTFLRWKSWKHRFSHLLCLPLLFPTRVHVIVSRRCSFRLYCIVICAHVCMPHSLKVDRFGSFCNICRKTSLECRLPCFYVSQIKYYAPERNNRTHKHIHVRGNTLCEYQISGWMSLSTIVGGHRRHGLTFTQYGFKLLKIGLSFTFTVFAMKNWLKLPE